MGLPPPPPPLVASMVPLVLVLSRPLESVDLGCQPALLNQLVRDGHHQGCDGVVAGRGEDEVHIVLLPDVLPQVLEASPGARRGMLRSPARKQKSFRLQGHSKMALLRLSL